MENQPEYIEPTTSSRLKIVATVLSIAAGIEGTKRWLAPAFMTHVHTLPKCEQWDWLNNAAQAAFFAVPLLLTIFILPIAIRLLRQKQFPLSSSWVWRRQKIQRGRIVVLRAYVLIFLCSISWVFPFWAEHIFARSSIQHCSSASADSTLMFYSKEKNTAPNLAVKQTPTLNTPMSLPSFLLSSTYLGHILQTKR